MSEQSVSFRVLRSVHVRSGSGVVKIAAPRQRALLAQLLVSANKTVSVSKLIDGIWGEAPPKYPDSALHIVVCRLRRALDDLARRLVRDCAGYRIEVSDDELDLTRAQALAIDAGRKMREGDAATAAATFDEALACWTGEPFADVSNFPFYGPTARQLKELRLGIVESRNAAYLRCGRHLEVLADIDALVEAEPWRERLRAHQMVALYRSDRQVEALAAYEALRRLLVSDFGVEPHADLVRLHGRILRRDPALLENRTDVQSQIRSVGAGGAAPNALGADDDADHDELVEQLRRISRNRSDIVVVDGGPNVERAWLVAELPSRIRDRASGDSLDDEDAFRRVSLADWLAEAR